MKKNYCPVRNAIFLIFGKKLIFRVFLGILTESEIQIPELQIL